MNYFFILGSHPALSLAELQARLSFDDSTLVNEVLLVELQQKPEAASLIASLGGTVKLGRIVGTAKNQAEVMKIAGQILKDTPKDGKFNFGISVYGKANIKTLALGLELKKALRTQGVSCRFVTSKEKTLSSVVVEQNKLTNGGVEFVLVGTKSEIHIGVTEVVQPFKDLSHRDYGRPARDDRSGMLPPKLAQMIINLSQTKADELLLDPFCGSGTVLTEAMLMGFMNVQGTDISAKAVADSKKNIDWIASEYGVDAKPEVSLLDARRLSDMFTKDSVAGIAAETYLGPQRGQFDIKKTSAELSKLYSNTLEQVSLILKPGGKAVFVLPAFGRDTNRQFLPLDLHGLKIVLPLAKQYQGMSGITNRTTLLYGRSDQNVWREIMVLEK